MKDNNPFQPSAAHNAADSGGAKKRRVMLDGISHDYDDGANMTGADNSNAHPAQNQAAMESIDPELLAQALNETTPPADALPSEEEIAHEAADVNNLLAGNSDTPADDMLEMNDFAENDPMLGNSAESTASPSENENNSDANLDNSQDKLTQNPDNNAPISAIDALAEKSDAKPLGANVGGEKPAKQFTISILTIILFIVTLAGVGCAIYFAWQNNKNANDLADAKAKVQELTEKQEQNGVNSETTTAQFDALQEKITKLTNDNDEKQKTLDENKKTIDEQKKKIDETEKNNTDLTKKVQNISDLTTRTDKMLKKLESIYSDAPTTNARSVTD